MDSHVFFYLATFLALVYAFWNGANDRANSIATIVKTRALKYWQAVLLAGVLNFAGPFLTVAVAKTIAKGIVFPEFITQPIILGGLVGAIIWSAFATWRGIPVSITHALIGGILGAGIAAWHSIDILALDTLFKKVFLGIILAPIAGFVFGFGFLILLKWIAYPFQMTRYSANRFWRWMQVFTSSWLSFSHGMNDGLNAVGIIALAYFTAGFSKEITVETWMILLGASAIGLGTAIMGWRVTHTIGYKITDLEPIDGCAAEAASAGVLLFASYSGMPVSTTHVAVSGILGAGGAKSLGAVNWKITRRIFIAWVLTVPAAAFVGAIAYYAFSLFI